MGEKKGIIFVKIFLTVVSLIALTMLVFFGWVIITATIRDLKYLSDADFATVAASSIYITTRWLLLLVAFLLARKITEEYFRDRRVWWLDILLLITLPIIVLWFFCALMFDYKKEPRIALFLSLLVATFSGVIYGFKQLRDAKLKSIEQRIAKENRHKAMELIAQTKDPGSA